MYCWSATKQSVLLQFWYTQQLLQFVTVLNHFKLGEDRPRVVYRATAFKMTVSRRDNPFKDPRETERLIGRVLAGMALILIRVPIQRAAHSSYSNHIFCFGICAAIPSTNKCVFAWRQLPNSFMVQRKTQWSNRFSPIFIPNRFSIFAQ